MAASELLRDGASISSSSLLALARKSHFPNPPHFYHGLLGQEAKRPTPRKALRTSRAR